MKEKIISFALVLVLTFASIPVATAAAQPHPYATALKEFFMDAEGETAAYLADVNGDGVDEMLAEKYEDEFSTKYRFFYILNGNLYTYDESYFEGAMLFTSNNHLASILYTGPLVHHRIHLFINGEFKPNAVAYSISPDNYNDDELDIGILSKSEAEPYNKQYGLDRNIDRPDDTAKILAMTIEEAPEPLIVKPATSTVYVNGNAVEFEAYLLDGNNYFKLRDLANVINGTNKQFAVGWDDAAEAITLISGQPYAIGGGEMGLGDGSAKPATLNANINISKDGAPVEITAYLIGGNNYVKLRDVMRMFDVGVTYNATTRNIGIDTRIGYTE